jgi:AraC family transcriptional activator of pobA
VNELFSIYLFAEEDSKRVVAAPDEPHVHDFEELLVGIEGELEHFIDFASEIVEAPYVSFVAQGKIHRVIPRMKNDRCKVWVIRFKSEFIPETIFQLYSFYHGEANLPVVKGVCFERINALCKMIFNEYQAAVPDYGVIRHLLGAIFTMIESERKKSGTKAALQKTQNITFRNFLKILEENFRRPDGVEFYAEKLFMSSRNLNLISQSIMQKSVTEMIETRKLIEAKNLLASTNKSVAEIGFEIGFNEKSYFTNVFKKRTGQTPTEFRNEMKKLIE